MYVQTRIINKTLLHNNQNEATGFMTLKTTTPPKREKDTKREKNPPTAKKEIKSNNPH